MLYRGDPNTGPPRSKFITGVYLFKGERCFENHRTCRQELKDVCNSWLSPSFSP